MTNDDGMVHPARLERATGDRRRLPTTSVQTSKDNVEAAAKKSMIRSEEFTKVGVCGIGANIARVEVIGGVKDA